MTRQAIAESILALAQRLAESKGENHTIAALVDANAPKAGNEGIDAIIRHEMTLWATTWLDVVQGGVSADSVDNGDRMKALMSIPLEKHLDVV